MIYHKKRIVGHMLWIQRVLRTRNVRTKLETVYAEDPRKPRTKAYSKSEIGGLFAGLEVLSIDAPLTHGDLLTSDVGQRHRGRLLRIAKVVHPRWLFRRLAPQSGLFLMMRAPKSQLALAEDGCGRWVASF